MPKRLVQVTKERVVRLVKNPILTEGLSMQAACQMGPHPRWLSRVIRPGRSPIRTTLRYGPLS
ncbi:Uncharacterised protein [Arcanobacterium haemolyticum]|nr:Uncharacterised protein [Arcanobacterium haemolyticum]